MISHISKMLEKSWRHCWKDFPTIHIIGVSNMRLQAHMRPSFSNFFTMATQYKYRLNELVMSLPRSVEIRTVAKMLFEHYGIPSVTFFRHRALLADAKEDMQSKYLLAYAAFFNVKPEELVTQKETRPSVYKLLGMAAARPSLTDVAAQAGMSMI